MGGAATEAGPALDQDDPRPVDCAQEGAAVRTPLKLAAITATTGRSAMAGGGEKGDMVTRPG